MRKFLCWLCIISVILVNIVTVSTVSIASSPSSATVTDVYASGNWTVGHTVTANFTYYDPAGNAQVGDAVVQWWRTKNLASKDEKIAESLNYTLTSEDKGGVYFTVKVTNAYGEGDVFYSPVYTSEDANSSATTPVKKKLHIILTGGARSFSPGATVRAVHSTSFTNGKSEGATSYMWRVKDTRSGSYTKRATTQTYTITESDYGKWLECAVTVKDSDGKSSGQLTSIIYVGNQLDFDATVESVTRTYSSNPNLINRLWYQNADSIYTYKGVDVSILIDAHKIVKFNGFNLNIKKISSDLKVSYSGNGGLWSEFVLSGTTTGDVNTLFLSESVVKARYFKISFKTDSSNYGIFYEAFPCLTLDGRNKDSASDIKSAGYGMTVNNDNFTVSGVTYGMTLKTLADSITTLNSNADVSIIDYSGNEISDTGSIKISRANIDSFYIKISCGSMCQAYSLVEAQSLKKIDFSDMPENKKYTEKTINGESTGYTRDIPGTTASYWYGAGNTADEYSYGIRENVGGSAALKIFTNNNGKSEVAGLWTGIKDIDKNGCYSFSFKVKPGIASHIKVNGRPNTKLSGAGFVNNFVELNTNGIYVYNGTELVRKADIKRSIWQSVEVVLDYKNNRNSVWVDGVNFANNVPFKIDTGDYDKTGLQMKISIFQGANGEEDINFIKDIEFHKVWDVTSGVTHGLNDKKQVVLSTSDINAMLISGEKVITSESVEDKKKQVSKYISATKAQFAETVVKSLPTALDVRPSLEIHLCRLAQLYALEGNEDYANKVYDALVKYANNHFVIKEKNTTERFDNDGRYLQPIYPAIAYNLLSDFNVSSFDKSYKTDTRALIESWLADTVDITYNQFSKYVTGNMIGFTIKHIAGIATILDDPALMRKAIYITDKVMAPELWFADGVWWEGSSSYARQIYGNLKEVFPLISKFTDPKGYVDELLNITLDGSDISLRYPMIQTYEEVVKNLVNPDGTAIAVNDTHFTYDSVVGLNLPITRENLNNVELNHFGLFALKSGNTQNAQQVSLHFPAFIAGSPFSGGHQHGSFLTMSLWAAGQELLPDAGYPFQTENYRSFHTASVAHNGSFIWDDAASNHAKYRFFSARPNLLRYDDGTQTNGNIQLIEAQQLMHPSMNIKDKRRLLMQIKTSENTSYVFDLQTLQGGDVHENFIRASEEEDVNVRVSATKTASTDNLGEYLENKGKKGLMPNQTLFTDADIYSGGDMNFTFEGDTSGSKLNAFVKGVEGSMAAFSNMPSLRRTDGDAALRDEFSTKHFYQRREVGANDVTHFAAVYEGVAAQENAYVKDVSWFDSDGAVFAVVDIGEYEDIICLSDNMLKKEFEGITFKTSTGWVRRNKTDKSIESAYVSGGGAIYTGSGIIACEDTFESEVKLTDVDLLGKNAIEIEDELPKELIGKWANVSFDDGSGLSFKIVRSDNNIVYTHNDVGFEFDNLKTSFTAFPSKKDASGGLKVTYEHKYTDLTDRIMNGNIEFKINSSQYGNLSDGITVSENGGLFQSLKSGSIYEVSGCSDDDFMMFVVIFRNDAIHKIYMSQNGEDIEFSLDKKLFEPDENGKIPTVYADCMLWNKNLVPLCKNITLR